MGNWMPCGRPLGDNDLLGNFFSTTSTEIPSVTIVDGDDWDIGCLADPSGAVSATTTPSGNDNPASPPVLPSAQDAGSQSLISGITISFGGAPRQGGLETVVATIPGQLHSSHLAKPVARGNRGKLHPDLAVQQCQLDIGLSSPLLSRSMMTAHRLPHDSHLKSPLPVVTLVPVFLLEIRLARLWFLPPNRLLGTKAASVQETRASPHRLRLRPAAPVQATFSLQTGQLPISPADRYRKHPRCPQCLLIVAVAATHLHRVFRPQPQFH